MDESLRQLIRARAGERCEYCGLPQGMHEERFSVDHVIPRKHGGSDDPSNLALARLRCNVFKGTDLSAIDPDTGAVVRSFHPRTDVWTTHFAIRGDTVVGLTSCGRATAKTLNMNAPERRRLRASIA